MRLAVADTETTGFKPPGAVLIEAAAIEIDTDRIFEADWIESWWCAFVDQSHQPEKFSAGAMSVNHITPHHVRGGLSMADVARRFSRYDVIAFHNASFDAQFLPDSYDGKFICTLQCAKKVWPDLAKHQNMHIRYELMERGHRHMMACPPYWTNSETSGAHRALVDTITTAMILRHMVVEEGHSIEEMIGWTTQPVPGQARNGR